MANSEPLPNDEQQARGKRPLCPEQSERIRALKGAKGLYRTADLLGCSKDVVLKVLAGEPLTPGSRALLAAAIERRDREGKKP